MDESDFIVVHWEGRTDVALGLVRLPSEVDVDLATLRSMVENQVEAIALQRGSGAGRDWDYRFLMPNRGAVAAASDRMEKGRVVTKKTRAAPAYVPIGRKQEIEMFLSDLLIGSPNNVSPSIVLRSVKASDADKPADSKPEKKSGCVFKTVVGLMVVAAFFFLAFHSGLSAHGTHYHHDDHHRPWGGQQPQPPHPWWNENPGQVAYGGDGGAYLGGGNEVNYGNPMPVYAPPPPEPQVAILIIEEVELQQPPLVMPMEEEPINVDMPADWPVMSPEDAWEGKPSSVGSSDMGWKSEEASSYAAVDLPAPIDRRRYLVGDQTSSSDEMQIQIDVPELMMMPREELPNTPSGGAFADPAQFPPAPQYHVDPVPPRDYGRDINFVDPQPPVQFLVDPMPGGAPWAHPGGPGGMPWARPGGPGGMPWANPDGHHGGHHDGHHHDDHHGYRLIERVALAIVYTVGSSVDGYYRTFVTCWAEMGTWLVRLIDAYFALLQNLIDHMLVWPVVVVLLVGVAVALHYAERIIAVVLPYRDGDLKAQLVVDPEEEDLAHVDDLVDEECPKLKN